MSEAGASLVAAIPGGNAGDIVSRRGAARPADSGRRRMLSAARVAVDSGKPTRPDAG